MEKKFKNLKALEDFIGEAIDLKRSDQEGGTTGNCEPTYVLCHEDTCDLGSADDHQHLSDDDGNYSGDWIRPVEGACKDEPVL